MIKPFATSNLLSAYGNERLSNPMNGILFILIALAVFSCSDEVEQRYLETGADNSYVNEMEDCGANYSAQGEFVDVYALFAERGCDWTRLRLWHTPDWHDTLNQGIRYSDLADVRKSMKRAKQSGMKVLLNFHLSDNWADPQRQEIPAAWKLVENDTKVLGDSLFNHIFYTLEQLAKDDLIPDMVQVGNETNIEILKYIGPDMEPEPIDWERNTYLMKRGIAAVRAFSENHQKAIKVALHLASPAELDELLYGFLSHGLSDFDVIGLSYYWAWHHPTTIAETKEIIQRTKSRLPDKELMIFETGYVWTEEWQDEAANIISKTHPDYEPASPAAQLAWLMDLSRATAEAGGTAVMYWEPAWVSTDCFTQWGRGSHQEHAIFFDFEHSLIEDGGIQWLNSKFPVKNIPADFSWQKKGDQVFVSLRADANIKGDFTRYKIFTSEGIWQAGDLNWSNQQTSLSVPDNQRFSIVLLGPNHEVALWNYAVSI